MFFCLTTMRGKNGQKTTKSEKKDLTFQSSQVIVRKKGCVRVPPQHRGLRGGGVSPARSVTAFHSLRILLLRALPESKQETPFVTVVTPLAVCSFTLRVNFAAPLSLFEHHETRPRGGTVPRTRCARLLVLSELRGMTFVTLLAFCPCDL